MSFHRTRALSFVCSLVLLGACDAPAPPTPPPVCGGVTLSPLRLAAGGRAEVVLDAALTAELTDVRAEGVEVFREEDRLIVRAGYEAGTHGVTATCSTGTLTFEVTVDAIAMEPLASWTASDTEAPPGREYFAWWIDGDGDVALYGGFVYQPRQFTPSSDAFRFDLETLTWSRLTVGGALPPPGGRVAPGLDGALLYFGGAELGADMALDTPPTLRAIEGSASELTFSALDAPGLLGSYTGSFVHDAERDRWLSVCGVETRSIGLHCQVHAYTEDGGFTPLEVTGPAPPGRYGFHYAMDVASDRVIVFGGQIGAGNTALSGDTWALELAPPDGGGPRWVQLFESSEGISRRRNAAYAYDPESRRLFVWGGTADGATSLPGIDVLSLDRGHERWTHVPLPESIPARTSGGGLLDAAHDRILFGFGNSAAIYTDLYALALAPRDGV